ncbi:hypothetical protein FJ364_05575, partial [Candidatus Dependentiae bacterium]|nr:hypothetical protein [Candidatus Dependentiae bacterium]
TFKFLTLHTFTGFLMMFGLLGLGLRYQFEYPISVALGLAVLAGLFVMFLVGVVFYAASRLTSQGSVFRISELIGLPAVVYQKITVHEDGKVQVVVRGIVREVTARATSGEIIESFEHVRIVGVVDEHTVLVEKNIQ